MGEGKKRATREAYGEALVELGGAYPNVVVLEADLAKSTTSIKFKEAYPERFFDCGVAEQNMMTIAAGLATTGKVCYTGSFAVFATGRAFEQVRTTICYSNLNVKLCPTHAGVTVGADGATHQTTEDIALMRAIPGMKVIVPCDFQEARSAIIRAYDIEGPVYVRLGRAPVPVVLDDDYRFELGQARVLKEGKDITILACGIMVDAALQAAETLASAGIEAEVINVSTLKPLDAETILASVSKTGKVVTAEEHSVIGGLGSAVSELLAENLPTRLRRIGVRDLFGTSGEPGELLDCYGLTPENIVEAVGHLISG